MVTGLRVPNWSPDALFKARGTGAATTGVPADRSFGLWSRPSTQSSDLGQVHGERRISGWQSEWCGFTGARTGSRASTFGPHSARPPPPKVARKRRIEIVAPHIATTVADDHSGCAVRPGREGEEFPSDPMSTHNESVMAAHSEEWASGVVCGSLSPVPLVRAGRATDAVLVVGTGLIVRGRAIERSAAVRHRPR